MRIEHFLLLLALSACNGDEQDDTGETDTEDTGESDDSDVFEDSEDPDDSDALPDVYTFTRNGASSVAYDGQIARQLLIADLTRFVGGLTARLNGGYFPEAGEVKSDLDFYYRFSSDVGGDVPFTFTSTPAPLQATYDEVSVGKDLTGKIAGNDATGQHKDWSTALVGWGTSGQYSPEGLVVHWFDQLDAAAIAWSNGDIPLGPDGAPVPQVYITAQGQDLQQLIQKFLVGAVAYSQGTDDYLDDDLPGHGLNTENVRDGTKAWNKLEHQWDEGFGYFGASQNYGRWSDDLIAGAAVADDINADGKIDLLSEVSWGHSTNAGKRDKGSASTAATDLTGVAWEGFLKGRALLAAADGPLSEAEKTALAAHRDQAVGAWELAIVATVVHYINDCIRDLHAEDYHFANHAKHWSEMKGFALSLQFNPRSGLSDAEFAQLHSLLGDAPVLPNAGEQAVTDHITDLLAARALLATNYAIDTANLGDDDGANGW